MSNTDQAFIDAYRRRRAPSPDLSPSPSPVAAGARAEPAPIGGPRAVPHAKHGPHVRFGGGEKAPLSQVLQAREEAAAPPRVGADAAGADPAGQVVAATQLARFAWPEVVADLVANHQESVAPLIGGVMQAWPVLGLAGCRPGSGATTITMAVARLLAAEGMPVAVIDADPASPELARGLGLVRQQTIAGTLAGGLPLSEATVHAVEDRVSLLVAGPLTQHPVQIGGVVEELRSRHAAVLVDLGADPRRLLFQPDAVALVHPFDESDAVVEYSSRSLRHAGAPLVGTIESLAPAA